MRREPVPGANYSGPILLFLVLMALLVAFLSALVASTYERIHPEVLDVLSLGVAVVSGTAATLALYQGRELRSRPGAGPQDGAIRTELVLSSHSLRANLEQFLNTAATFVCVYQSAEYPGLAPSAVELLLTRIAKEKRSLLIRLEIGVWGEETERTEAHEERLRRFQNVQVRFVRPQPVSYCVIDRTSPTTAEAVATIWVGDPDRETTVILRTASSSTRVARQLLRTFESAWSATTPSHPRSP